MSRQRALRCAATVLWLARLLPSALTALGITSSLPVKECPVPLTRNIHRPIHLVRPPPSTPRSQVVLRVIQPYTRVRIVFIAQQLNVPAGDVEQLLISLILDGRIKGRIDQVQQVGRWRDGWPLAGAPTSFKACCWVGGGRVGSRDGTAASPRGWPAAGKLLACCYHALGAPPCPLHSQPPAPSPTLGCALQLLELDIELEQGPKYTAIDKWAQQLHSLHAQVAAKLAA